MSESCKRMHYFILYTADSGQQLIVNLINRYLSKDSGEAFVPKMEYYKRGEKTVKVKNIFPGYVFVYTGLNMKEFHDLIKDHRKEFQKAIRELGVKAMQQAMQMKRRQGLPDMRRSAEEIQ